MFIKIKSCAVFGLNCAAIEVEVDLSRAGKAGEFSIIGLPDLAIQEARKRIWAAIKNSGAFYPYTQHLLINLAPADIRKEGPAYDLPMAVGIMCAMYNYDFLLDDTIFIGELSLEGKTRATNGILPITIWAQSQGFKKIFVPAINAPEAALVDGLDIYPVKDLEQLIKHLSGEELIEKFIGRPITDLLQVGITSDYDMAFVKGQENVKRALEIAASGAHNLLMSGPPGSGKTLLARTLPTILPAMTISEVLEVTKIYSIAGLLPKDWPIVTERPFRSPHHTSSGVALVGGGKFPRPGEISLAHRGVLFLDEFPEFPRQVVENLRQPLSDGLISISRAQGTLTFPARFTLVAAQNPCPCGYSTDPDKECHCTPIQVANYHKKISGPIIDRIDLHIEVPRVNFDKLHSDNNGESSATIRGRVQAARERQVERFKNLSIKTNAEMRPQEIREFCPVDEATVALLKNAVVQMHLSARSYHRILKLARTIADLAGVDKIALNHVAEALQYRPKNNH